MNISLQELFDNHLAVQWWVAAENIYLLAPALVGHAGGMYPADPRGRCIFLKEERCSIHEVKPNECRFYRHDVNYADTQANREKVYEAWKEHQSQIEELLGEPPYENLPENLFSFFDIGYGYGPVD